MQKMVTNRKNMAFAMRYMDCKLSKTLCFPVLTHINLSRKCVFSILLTLVNTLLFTRLMLENDFLPAFTAKENYWIMEWILGFTDAKTHSKRRIFGRQNTGKRYKIGTQLSFSIWWMLSFFTVHLFKLFFPVSLIERLGQGCQEHHYSRSLYMHGSNILHKIWPEYQFMPVVWRILV